MNPEKRKKKHVLLKGNICSFPNHLANVTRGITSVFGNKLFLFECHMCSTCFENELSPCIERMTISYSSNQVSHAVTCTYK